MPDEEAIELMSRDVAERQVNAVYDLPMALQDAQAEADIQLRRAEAAEAALRLVEEQLGEHRCPYVSRHPSLQDLVPAARHAVGLDELDCDLILRTRTRRGMA